MFSDVELDDFNKRLVDINTSDALLNTKAALYVVVVNDWELMLETTIAPLETITKLDQLGSRAREDAFNSLKTSMATVPLAVAREIESDKDLVTAYVHLMANIRVYDKPDVIKNKVTPKQFTVVVFPESLVRYGLKGVSHINTLGGKAELIKENIRLFGQHFQKPIDVNLEYNYVIPVSERTNIEKALDNPLRVIEEKPYDPKRSVYDYSNLIPDETKLAALERLSQNLRKGDDNDIYLKTFYTDYRMSSAQLDEIRDYTQNLGRNDLVAWVHLENAAGEVTSGLFFGPGLEQRLTKDFLDHTKKLLVQSVKVYHKFSSIPVKGLAWVAGGLGKILRLAEISPTYYDPSLGQAYDPSIFLFYYMGHRLVPV